MSTNHRYFMEGMKIEHDGIEFLCPSLRLTSVVDDHVIVVQNDTASDWDWYLEIYGPQSGVIGGHVQRRLLTRGFGCHTLRFAMRAAVGAFKRNDWVKLDLGENNDRRNCLGVEWNRQFVDRWIAYLNTGDMLVSRWDYHKFYWRWEWLSIVDNHGRRIVKNTGAGYDDVHATIESATNYYRDWQQAARERLEG